MKFAVRVAVATAVKVLREIATKPTTSKRTRDKAKKALRQYGLSDEPAREGHDEGDK